MKITEVRVKLLTGYEGDEKLRGFCSITFDDEYVVRDIKIIEGARGLFVAMPSRRVTARCQKCGNKNHLRARFCNECGVGLSSRPHSRHERGSTRLFVDIAHPINQEMRHLVHDSIMEEFELEVTRSEQREDGHDKSPYPQQRHISPKHRDDDDRSMEAGI